MTQDRDALDDIYLTTLYALEFIQGKTRQEFYADMQMQAALRHKLMVIGEAVKRLSISFRESHQEIPWSKIAGMRDRLAHQYDTVDLNIIWEAIEQELPTLRMFLEPICSKRAEPNVGDRSDGRPDYHDQVLADDGGTNRHRPGPSRSG